MSQAFEASKSLAGLEQDSTIIAVIEMSQSQWLVAEWTRRPGAFAADAHDCIMVRS
jgi:hypothetical protein